MDSLKHWIHRLPKIELHLHLEGSIRPSVLRLLASRNGVSLPPTTGSPEPAYRYGNFLEFLECFKTACSVLSTPDDLAFIADDLFDQLIAQNIVHAEVFLSPVIHERKGIPTCETMRLIHGIAEQKRRDHGFSCLFLFDAVRQWGVESCRQSEKLAEDCQQWGVAGIGIGGDEGSLPASLFAAVFRRACDAGLHRTAHAGEACGAASIHDALECLQPERIGHGIRAVEDPSLLRRLGDEGVTLDISLTSNIKTGVWPDFESHPISRLHRNKVSFSLNTDDPALFGTDLSSEYLLGATILGWGQSDLERLVHASLTASFLPPSDKVLLKSKLS